MNVKRFIKRFVQCRLNNPDNVDMRVVIQSKYLKKYIVHKMSKRENILHVLPRHLRYIIRADQDRWDELKVKVEQFVMRIYAELWQFWSQLPDNIYLANPDNYDEFR